MKVMAKGKELTRPRHRQKMPPAVWRSHRFQRRPRIPNLLAMKSEVNPPNGRAMMFAIPNVAAMIPAR